jgi:hypothetical protein
MLLQFEFWTYHHGAYYHEILIWTDLLNSEFITPKIIFLWNSDFGFELLDVFSSSSYKKLRLMFLKIDILKSIRN